MGKRPTILMVAERAGVSRGTVDRVINGRAYVRGDVRERVMQAMREVGYVPLRMDKAQALGMVPAARPLTLGVLLPDWSGHFLKEVTMGIEEARRLLADFGVRILVDQCETEIPDECLEKLDKLLAGGAEGVALCTKDHPAIRARIDELAERGVPVVTFNSDVPISRRVCFVGQDVPRSGRVAGELMSKCVPPGSRVLAAVGNLEFDGHKQRLMGFLDQMEERGFAREQIEVVQTYNDFAMSYERVRGALRRLPDIAGVYMANHSVTGCAEAIREEGRQGQIRVVSHDVTGGSRRLLRDGALDFVIAQDLRRQGYRPLTLLYDLLRREEQPGELSESPSLRIVCSQNLDDN